VRAEEVQRDPSPQKLRLRISPRDSRFAHAAQTAQAGEWTTAVSFVKAKEPQSSPPSSFVFLALR
jgi:hypothetical protein